MKDIMIEMKEVVFEYKSYIEDEILVAVNKVNLKVEKGEFLVILGHNG